MKNIVIENAQVKTKIKNFVKTCDSVLLTGKDLEQTMQVVNALKVLLRFLKNDSALCEVYEIFDGFEKINDAYSFAKEILSNDFVIALEDGGEVETIVSNYKYKVGDIVQFGKKVVRDLIQPLTWKVINAKENEVLLFAEKSYLWEAFDTDGKTVWENCTLRNKLNSEWLKEVFTEEEIEAIVPIEYDNCKDYIFILPLEDIIRFVPELSFRCDSKSSWWTSSSIVNDITLKAIQRNGEILDEGAIPTKKLGVRPVLWIKNQLEEVSQKPFDESKDTDLSIKKVIVVQNGDDYYIAFVSNNDEITSNILRKFSPESAHFNNLQEAQEAVDIYKSVNANKYNVEELHIDLTELVNKEYEEANRMYVVTDQEGKPIVYIDAEGNRTIPTLEEEVKYLIVDKIKYQNIIKRMIEINESQLQLQLQYELDYYFIGTSTGYKVAYDCNVSRIRYEIFKAKEVLQDFEEYQNITDIHSDDIKYYNGYIEAMTNALTIQKNCILGEENWSLDVVDLRNDGYLTEIYDTEGYIPQYGNYSLHIYNEIPFINFDDGSRHIVIVFVRNEGELPHRDAELALNLPDDILFVFGSDKMQANKKHVNQLILNTIKAQCSLGAGDADYRIPEDMVPALVNYSEFSDEDSDIEINEVDGIDHSAFVKTLDLRFIDGEAELHKYEFRDNSILQSIKLPMRMKNLPEGIFFNCKSLNYVSLPDNVKVIGKSSFEGCVSLWRLFLPDPIKKIEDRAFYGCSDLKKIFLPAKLEHIGSEAFCGCRKLTKIYLPSSIKYIANDAFDGCISLKKVDAPIGCQLPDSILAQAKIRYYTEFDNPQQSENEDDEDVNEENDVQENDVITNDDVIEKKIESNIVSTKEQLEDVILLLESSFENTIVDLSSVINFLDKECKND